MLEQVLRSREPRVAPPGAGGAETELENPTDLLLVIVADSGR